MENDFGEVVINFGVVHVVNDFGEVVNDFGETESDSDEMENDFGEVVNAFRKTKRVSDEMENDYDFSYDFVSYWLSSPDELYYKHFNMDKQVFEALHNKVALRPTMQMSTIKRIAIFLHTIAHDLPTENAEMGIGFYGQHSCHFDHVLDAIIKFSSDCFDPPTSHVPPKISSDSRFFPFFKDCLGYVDALRIPMYVGENDEERFHQNVALGDNLLAVCSFDLKFQLVLANFEGTAVKTEGLDSAITKLKVPNGKYYLVDERFQGMLGFVAPYPGSVYYSGDLPGGFNTTNQQQLFNQRHWELRKESHNIFKALLERFPILMSSTRYPKEIKEKLIIACCALHNFILEVNPDDAIFKKLYGVYEADLVAEGGYADEEVLPLEDQINSEQREAVAASLWNDHVSKS
ncbi:hypothetical protein ACFE04_009820 [Oxalis oulophora]